MLKGPIFLRFCPKPTVVNNKKDDESKSFFIIVVFNISLAKHNIRLKFLVFSTNIVFFLESCFLCFIQALKEKIVMHTLLHFYPKTRNVGDNTNIGRGLQKRALKRG
jgi:hypothetical protein